MAMTAKLHRDAGTYGSGDMAETRDRVGEWTNVLTISGFNNIDNKIKQYNGRRY